MYRPDQEMIDSFSDIYIFLYWQSRFQSTDQNLKLYSYIQLFFTMQDNPLENLNLAFDIAEKYLDIPKMLDAEGRTH